MEYEFRAGGKTHAVAIEKKGERWHISVDGRALEADIVAAGPNVYSAVIEGETVTALVVKDGPRRHVSIGGRIVILEEPAAAASRTSPEEEIAAGVQTIKAPMPGRVVKIAAAEGAGVKKGQTIVVVEAMKMEHALSAAGAGVVQKILCAEGQNVDASQALAEVHIGAEG